MILRMNKTGGVPGAKTPMNLRRVVLGISAIIVLSATAQQTLTIEQVMSPEELKSTGVSTFTQAQRKEGLAPAEVQRLSRRTVTSTDRKTIQQAASAQAVTTSGPLEIVT